MHVNQKQNVPKAFSISEMQRQRLVSEIEDENKRKENLKEIFQIKQQVTTVDPKVTEPYDPIPGRVPRKVAIDRKKKEYANFDIEELLLQEGIDYNSKENNYVQWLQLELFDDNTFDDYINNYWIEKAKQESELGHALTGKGLYLDPQDQRYKWKNILIFDYQPDTQLFKATWTDNDDQQVFDISRINFVLNAENPKKFALRVATAHRERIKVDSLIRYNYYIDNMPIQDLNDLDAEQKRRLEMLTRTKKLEGIDPTPLLMDVSYEYSRTMNKIIFDKYLDANLDQLDNKDVFPIKLNLEAIQQENNRFVNNKYFGMVKLESQQPGAKEYVYENQKKQVLEPSNFTETFKNFCFASLYIKEEVIKALQDIRKECNKVLELKMYNYDAKEFPPQMHLEEFKNIQDAATSKLFYKLKGEWVNQLISIIKTEFQGVGKGWFNMKETSKVTYDFGKLKRFLTVVRLVMQDTLLSLMKNRQREFVDYFDSFIPQQVTIHSTSHIDNLFLQPDGSLASDDDKRSLFTIDLNKNPEGTDFVFSTNPQNFVTTLLTTYDKSIEEGNKIPDIEPFILSDLFKSNKNDAFIKSPVKTKERPQPVSSSTPKPKTPVIDEHKWVWDLYGELETKMSKAILPLYDYLERFQEFKEILEIRPDEYVREIEMEENQREVEEIKLEIYQVRQKRQDLENRMPECVHVSMFDIQCKDILVYMLEKYEQLEKNLLNLISKRYRESNRVLSNQFEQITHKLKEQPEDIEALTELKEYMQNLPNELMKIDGDQKASLEIYKILEEFNYKFSKEDMNKRWQVFGNTKEVIELMDLRKNALEKDKVKFLENMRNNQQEFKQMVESLEQTIHNFHSHQKIDNHEEIAKNVESVQSQLVQYVEDAKKYNFRESLFELDEQTDFSQLQSMGRDFQPYSNLWTITHKWKSGIVQWLNGAWDELNAEEAEKFIDDSSRTLMGVIRHFKEKDHGAVLKIAELIKQEIDQFKPKVPLMVALRKNGMKKRHWEQISEKVDMKVEPDENFTFQQALDMGLLAHSDICCEIGEKASKEFQIETMLDQMQNQWENINFNLLEYKSTFIIKGADDIQQVIDEHLVNTQSMQFSPFKKPFEERIQNWNDKLKLMGDIMEEWLKCQSQWMYLQPIFDSADIAKQLPQETKKFKTVDQTWKHTMNQANTFAQVLKVCSDQSVLDKLQEANKNLDMIQKELDNYLGKKREKFARFYFLSNDDLLDILSQAKDPTAVQPFLKKVFENMNEVEFNDAKPPKIKSMRSAEKEQVEFINLLDPNGKNVEDWMGELEDMMKQSVRAALLQSIQTYPTPSRTEWVRANPGQCVLNGSQVHWTNEVEEAIKSKGVEGIAQYVLKLNDQLNDLVDLVRQKLSPMETITLNALIVIDVHARDVTTKLVNNQVSDIGVFEWISQLRYYWEQDDCYVKCIQTVFPYGYEYLGNTNRLVITDLTDKCYMTLMGALKLNLGGAPAGPAGTGKTESTKDLAKGLAKQCVVFNCSDQMDYLMVGKFFKGLASAGAWCCFDEFNRINIEVLSVIAMQLQQLFSEKAIGKQFTHFEGSDIKLNPTFSVFITMNPGYAGRTELPDNLKALFRGVAMMVPNYALIAQIRLYSFGFREGKDLSKKIVTTFKMASESLSSQCHYDYGMRAVTSVINNAGILKAADPDMDEDKLVLRALKDVNVPKFLSHDLPLFENIINDLFPTTEKPVINYGNLLDAINDQTNELGYQQVQVFTEKILQLYDTIQVRHGLMLVGPTGGGKTACYRTLQKALSKLQHEGYYNVITHILNPKSVTMGQLYGCFNEQTREWTDGVLANMIREAIKDRSEQKHWVVFDGPVDALWIESMNTVLDDNKKLCLNSGQIMTLTNHMTMMFEVEDLLVASPATVSRCGMVYMEPVSLGIQPLVDSWVQNSIPANITTRTSLISKINQFFEIFLKKTLLFLRENCVETDESSDNQLTQCLTRMLSCFIEPYRETEYKKISVEEIETLESQIEQIFFFCVVWSLCCTVDDKSRKKFDTFIKQLCKDNKIQIINKLFEENSDKSIYNFKFDTVNNQFVGWQESFANFDIDPKLQYHEVMVPTIDSTRNIFITKILLNNKFHVMCPGPTGTGKSLNLYTLLGKEMGDDFQYVALTFSAQTSANSTQDTIDSKLKKRRKGIFGPPVGKKCVIFVDDLNMPKKEEFFAQPPLELLRQFLDHQGWYDRKSLAFMKLQDIILLAAQGPPGGGRTFITARLKRHFNMLSYTEIEDTEIVQIFGTLCRSFLKKFQESVRNQIQNIIEASMKVYKEVKEELLPTPSKSHYSFNLRDIWRVVQGICGGSARNIADANDICRLWFHENMRVYHDRLTTEEDRTKSKELLYKQINTTFKLNKDDIMNAERIIFGDFLQGRDMEIKQYTQINDLETLLMKMERFQDDFNSDSQFSGGGKKQMKLVMFLDACEHICRIARIIRQPQGNAFLMGVGGSGRQSLSKMATFISNFKLFQIEVIKNYNIRAWREDVKKLLMLAGVENKPVTFLFVDTQIISEQMLEDINNILNSGDVTGVYNAKDLEDIKKVCKADCVKKNLQPNEMNIFGQYLARIKKNIHVIIAMSPLGEVFTTRLRMFPSLVNCCTIDWFTEWPDEALIGVGKGSLQDYQEELGIQNQLDIMVEMFKVIHKSVEKITIKFKEEIRRYNYVTPTSFLELLNLFRKFLTEKRISQFKSIDRLKNGLDKLNGANEAVEQMGVQLQEMQPILEATQEETQKTMEKLKVDNEHASKQQVIVTKEEQEAKQQAEEANKLAEEAEEAVREANDKLNETLKLVAKLRKEHIQEIKTFNNPTPVVKLVIKGVVLILMEYVKKNGGKLIIKTEGGKKEEDYFETCKKYLMQDPQYLLTLMKEFKEEAKSMKQTIIKKLDQEVLNQDEFNLEAAQNSSYVIQFLFNWVTAMYSFNIEYVRAGPLRKQMEDMKQIVADKEAELKIKKESLQQINDKIQELEMAFNEKMKLKDELTRKITDCELKKDRAEKLTGGLKDEKVRWTKDISDLTAQLDLLPGDSLISAGMVSYAGPFTNAFRTEMEQGWIAKLAELGIRYSEGIKMSKFLGQPVKIQSWVLAGLPKDDTSIENGIIIDKSRRWPLMIDPQNQANKYIKNMGRDQPETIEVLKTTDPGLMKTIELSIQFGRWVLVENVGESLDPSLEPILLQQTTKTGSSLTIVVGDKNIPYNDNFKFFMTTTLPNPHYSPETQVKVTVINFAITPSGLEEQMLATIVGLENPTLEQKKIEIVRKNAADKKQLLSIEDSILKSLGETTGGIEEMLADEKLIIQLQSSKKFAQEINQRVKDSKVTEDQIDIVRDSYRPVAFRASLLFFCILDLSTIDSMYQYSLQWFNYLFVNSVDQATPSNVLEERLQNLNDYFTYQLYENICRSLFETHKLLFSFILTVKILQGQQMMDDLEWRYILTGPTGDIHVEKNPTDWIADNSWPEMYRQFYKMDELSSLKGIKDYFMQNTQEFKPMFDSPNPHECQLPGQWHSKLNSFQKLIILKALRSDKLINGVQNWISEKIGQQFIMNPSWEYSKCYKDSKVTTPLIIILSSGSDPKDDFTKFCEEMGMSKRNESISLGQGQGTKAALLIKEAQNRGGWVLLQNCHLAKTWMSELEKICEELNENISKDFRLWLTSTPTPDFPISVLQNGIKMTMEPPKGLRNNLLKTYNNFDQKELDDCSKPDEFKRLIFGFSLFHAVILDRRKFGPIGWNIGYDFTSEDFTVCKRQLKMLLDEYQAIPFKVLQFLGAEINYGGRVTDDKDIRLITTIIKQYVCPEALRINHSFSASGLYKQPDATSLLDYLTYIQELPLDPLPEVFGLHDNAAITNAQNETRALLETILSIQPRQTTAGAKSREQLIEEIAIGIQQKTPDVFDEKQIGIDFATNYNESMNTVLTQEVIRYNRLLVVMIQTLVNVKKALKGTIQLSEELLNLANSLYDNQVPTVWSDVGFLSMKPLASWIIDLEKRIAFLQDWITNGTPKIFWISGFFFPQAFLTGTLQNFSRKYVIAIDQISFDFHFQDTLDPQKVESKPEDGCLIYGMFLEGAKWDYKKHLMGMSYPKELFSDLPPIHLMPVANRVMPEEGIYECPLYKVEIRKGTLMTTGHSTNYVMYVEIPTKESQEHWIKAGVASFLALRY